MSVTITADRLFSELIRSRGHCERCGSPRDLECAHVLSRRYLNTRWREENARCLCMVCHRWAHQFPGEFIHWIGDDYTALYRLAQRLDKVDVSDVLKRLRARLKETA